MKQKNYIRTYVGAFLLAVCIGSPHAAYAVVVNNSVSSYANTGSQRAIDGEPGQDGADGKDGADGSNGSSSASVSIKTIVNGEVVTDIHKTETGNNESPAFVDAEETYIYNGAVESAATMTAATNFSSTSPPSEGLYSLLIVLRTILASIAVQIF